MYFNPLCIKELRIDYHAYLEYSRIWEIWSQLYRKLGSVSIKHLLNARLLIREYYFVIWVSCCCPFNIFWKTLVHISKEMVTLKHTKLFRIRGWRGHHWGNVSRLPGPNYPNRASYLANFNHSVFDCIRFVVINNIRIVPANSPPLPVIKQNKLGPRAQRARALHQTNCECWHKPHHQNTARLHF